MSARLFLGAFFAILIGSPVVTRAQPLGEFNSGSGYGITFDNNAPIFNRHTMESEIQDLLKDLPAQPGHCFNLQLAFPAMDETAIAKLPPVLNIHRQIASNQNTGIDSHEDPTNPNSNCKKQDCDVDTNCTTDADGKQQCTQHTHCHYTCLPPQTGALQAKATGDPSSCQW